MSNDSQRQAIGDEFASIEKKFGNELDLADPEAIKEIRSFLESNSNYEEIEKRENDKKRDVFAHKKQIYPVGYILGASLTVIGAALLGAIVPNAISIKFNQNQVNDGKSLSYISVRNESVIVFSVVFALGAILAVLNYIHTHKKHIDENAQYEHKTTQELLGRLENIRKEVELKNRVLNKIKKFVAKTDNSFNLNDDYIETSTSKNKDKGHVIKVSSKEASAHENTAITYKDNIIRALEADDNIESWQLIDKALIINQLNFNLAYPHVLSYMKIAFRKKYSSFLSSNLESFEKESLALQGLFNLAFVVLKNINENNNEKIRLDIEPTDFICLCLVQALQNKERWIAQDILYNAVISIFQNQQVNELLSNILRDELENLHKDESEEPAEVLEDFLTTVREVLGEIVKDIAPQDYQEHIDKERTNILAQAKEQIISLYKKNKLYDILSEEMIDRFQEDPAAAKEIWKRLIEFNPQNMVSLKRFMQDSFNDKQFEFKEIIKSFIDNILLSHSFKAQVFSDEQTFKFTSPISQSSSTTHKTSDNNESSTVQFG